MHDRIPLNASLAYSVKSPIIKFPTAGKGMYYLYENAYALRTLVEALEPEPSKP